MLDKTDQHSLSKAERRESKDYAIGLSFFGVVGVAMIAWIAAIIWISWRLIAWFID